MKIKLIKQIYDWQCPINSILTWNEKKDMFTTEDGVIGCNKAVFEAHQECFVIMESI